MRSDGLFKPPWILGSTCNVCEGIWQKDPNPLGFSISLRFHLETVSQHLGPLGCDTFQRFHEGKNLLSAHGMAGWKWDIWDSRDSPSRTARVITITALQTFVEYLLCVNRCAWSASFNSYRNPMGESTVFESHFPAGQTEAQMKSLVQSHTYVNYWEIISCSKLDMAFAYRNPTVYWWKQNTPPGTYKTVRRSRVLESR